MNLSTFRDGLQGFLETFWSSRSAMFLVSTSLRFFFQDLLGAVKMNFSIFQDFLLTFSSLLCRVIGWVHMAIRFYKVLLVVPMNRNPCLASNHAWFVKSLMDPLQSQKITSFNPAKPRQFLQHVFKITQKTRKIIEQMPFKGPQNHPNSPKPI